MARAINTKVGTDVVDGSQ